MGKVNVTHLPGNSVAFMWVLVFRMGIWLIQVIDDMGFPSVIITLLQAELTALILCHQHLICVCCSPPQCGMWFIICLSQSLLIPNFVLCTLYVLHFIHLYTPGPSVETRRAMPLCKSECTRTEWYGGPAWPTAFKNVYWVNEWVDNSNNKAQIGPVNENTGVQKVPFTFHVISPTQINSNFIHTTSPKGKKFPVFTLSSMTSDQHTMTVIRAHQARPGANQGKDAKRLVLKDGRPGS